MLTVTKLTCEGLKQGCVTDNPRPRFSFALASERADTRLAQATVTVGGWSATVNEQTAIVYDGAPLQPFTTYTVRVCAKDNHGEQATAQTTFETGRMHLAWQAKWITDKDYRFTEKRVSPRPMTFLKHIRLKGAVKSAKLYATALGIYELAIDGQKVGEDYFAPGFTSYEHTLQYQTYDVANLLKEECALTAVVAGGWAVGSFVFTRKNRITAPRQAFKAELRIEYANGETEVVGTDTDWQVTMDGAYRAADFYDGETFDARVRIQDMTFHAAGEERVKIAPDEEAAYGAPVRAHEELVPISCTQRADGELVYDFGQNFAGVIKAEINGVSGQTIVFRHAEILRKDGGLNTALLRSAKATATYICTDGAQSYSPRLTYMGFRYVGVTGVKKEDLKLSALALYSDLEQTGTFTCSSEKLNKLQSNIVWSAKSNFMDIPTDCPQRDERMGWTGDIALFAPTACYNFNMSRFLEKWLRDVKDEQLKSGGIPNTVPVQGYGFPATMPVMAVDFWGDACVLVPYAEYMARGDKDLLEKMYPTMQKYVKACAFWARFCSVGKRRYIWNTLSTFHFGDWVAPDVSKMSGWQKRRTWTATASLANTSGMLSQIARILGREEDAKKYAELSEKVKRAYRDVLTDGAGKLKKEFQTGYVLPLYYNIFTAQTQRAAADNLAALVKKNGYCIGTGFPGTPYILFALADNGHLDDAFAMLTNEKCPSWLYEVKAGGTTIWERWDALKEDGTLNAGQEDGTGGMVSFNHYASGAVGDFLYRRIAGIEPIAAGYKTFRIAPRMGGGLTSARGSVQTPYGEIVSDWKIADGTFRISVQVPVGTECTLVMPSGESKTLRSGVHEYGETYAEGARV